MTWATRGWTGRWMSATERERPRGGGRGAEQDGGGECGNAELGAHHKAGPFNYIYKINNLNLGATGFSGLISCKESGQFRPHIRLAAVVGTDFEAVITTLSTRLALGLTTPLLMKLPFPEGGLNYGIL